MNVLLLARASYNHKSSEFSQLYSISPLKDAGRASLEMRGWSNERVCHYLLKSNGTNSYIVRLVTETLMTISFFNFVGLDDDFSILTFLDVT
jgi:hypothetical protein